MKTIKLFRNVIITIITLQGILMGAQIKNIEIKGIKVPVVFEKETSLPILNMSLVFQNSGSINDKNLNGLANFSAKLLNEGTKELGSTKFASMLESNAISLYSKTNFESFEINLSCLKQSNKKAFLLLKKLLKDPNYDEKVMDKIKTIQIGYLKREENNFDYVASKQLNTILFKNTPLEKPLLGTIDSISKTKLKDVKGFISNTFNLSNLVIVAGGDIEFKQLEEKLKKLLSFMPKGEKKKTKRFNASAQGTTKRVEKQTQQAYIYFGSKFNAKPKDEKNYMAKIASFILGGSGFGSRLMEEIRVKRGLAYSAYSYIGIYNSHSYFTGHLQTKLKSEKEAQKLVSQIVKKFVKDGVTKEELDAAKKFIMGSEPLRTETLNQRLHRSYILYARGLKQDYPKKELKKINNLQVSDLNNYIKSHDEILNLSFSIVGK